MRGPLLPVDDAANTSVLAHPAGWAAITAAAVLVVFAVLRPPLCSASPECAEIAKETPYMWHACAAAGLGTVFLHELASVVLSYKSVSKAGHVIGHLRTMLHPSALLCVTFAVLFAENMIMCLSTSPWYAHYATIWRDKHAPVNTVFYAEWLINVPILLTLAGKCALAMPWADIARPVVVTNLYIIAAWACYFIDTDWIRYAVVALSFAMYGWASVDMCRWVRRFLRDHPESRSGLHLRPFLTVALVVIFGIYGLVYLGRLHGAVSAHEERLFFTLSDIGSKLLVSMVFTGVRSSEYHAMLLDMVVNTNTVFQRTMK